MIRLWQNGALLAECDTAAEAIEIMRALSTSPAATQQVQVQSDAASRRMERSITYTQPRRKRRPAYTQPRMDRSGTYLQYTLDTLAEIASPLHILDLQTHVETRAGRQSTRASLEGTIARHLKKWGDKSLIVRVGPSTYTLRDNVKHEPPDTVSFIQAQNPQVITLLSALYTAATEVNVDDLAVLTGIPKALAGVNFGALSKAAKKAHIPLDTLYTTDVRFEGGVRMRWYAPGESLMEYGGRIFGDRALAAGVQTEQAADKE